MEKIRIGCSGWNYRHWRGDFYPETLPQRLWFEHYASQFDTVEINNSFYRLPSSETFAKWRDQAPSGFCYSVKANRFLTQAKKLRECEEPLARMVEPMRSLVPRLGPILYQLPPSLRFDPERLSAFLRLLPGDLIHVFEFRDPSWYVPATFDLLESHDASFCVHDMAGSASEQVAIGPVAYLRFHGAGGKYVGRYSDHVLQTRAEWLIAQARAGRPAWCYFNNDIGGHAPEDARTLRALVAQSR